VRDDWTVISTEVYSIFDKKWEVGLGYEAEVSARSGFRT